MLKSQITTTATKIGVYTAVAVLVFGPIPYILQEGPTVLTRLAFWFSLYGWLAAAIFIGYLIYLGSRVYLRLFRHDIASLSPDASATPTQSMAGTHPFPNWGSLTQALAGKLPSWEFSDDLPDAPRFNFRNAVTFCGAGAILLGTSIGSGEWVIGPAVTAEYGGYLLWIATVSIILQVVMNTAFIPYSLYTGEPIFTGFMRTWPGPKFWAIFYSILAFLQFSWCGWAALSATAMVALVIGEMPSSEHAVLVKSIGVLCFLLTIAIVLFGDRIVQTMELMQWFFVIAILLFLIAIGVTFIPLSTWGSVASGFVRFAINPPDFPPDVDWVKLGAFAAEAGAGGMINVCITNWYRDKGFGMGKKVGYISGLFGGRNVSPSPFGKVFPLTPENMKRWQKWWKFVSVDQYGLWVIGSFLGIGLTALLTLRFIPAGTEFNNEYGAAVYLALNLARDSRNVMWFITLLVGFLMLFSSQLGVTEVFTRIVTDTIWSARARQDGDIRVVYYVVLMALTLWGIFILFSDLKPLFLVLLSANMAGLNFVFLGLHALYVNRKFLPPQLRPPLWIEAIVVLGVIFFAFFFLKAIPGIVQELLQL